MKKHNKNYSFARLFSVAECKGCAEILNKKNRGKMPVRCPVCNRQTSELLRELYFVQAKREALR
jgi:predicted Zn-ribbon and HTH transcriptional regulator